MDSAKTQDVIFKKIKALPRILSLDLILFSLLLILAALLRSYHLDWDQGHLLHPDERAILATAYELTWPKDFHQLWQINSSLNPHFFSYGGVLFYLIAAFAGISHLLVNQYLTLAEMSYYGRMFSVLFDLGSILFIYRISLMIYGRQAAFLGAFFYSLAALPIQLCHFYAVDLPLNLFLLFSLFLLMNFYKNRSARSICQLGLVYGLALGVKFPAIILLITISCLFLLVLLEEPKKIIYWLKLAILFSLCVSISFFSFNPYALIDHTNYLSQLAQQTMMYHTPYSVPYTLQYVHKINYLYEIQNIFWWGLAPSIASLGFIGIIWLFLSVIKPRQFSNRFKLVGTLLLLIYFCSYFLIIGHSAVAFMRYMLPTYPILCIAAGAFSARILLKLNFSKQIYFVILGAVLTMLWPMTLLTIYATPHVRITASEWIYAHVPVNSKLMIEEWDDSLPLSNLNRYSVLTYNPYEPDTPEKLQAIKSKLKDSDYLILASARAFKPLSALAQCDSTSSRQNGHCFPLMAKFYRLLYNNELHYHLIQSFQVQPTVPWLNIPIDDRSADESFSVYDHPQIFIFHHDKS